MGDFEVVTPAAAFGRLCVETGKPPPSAPVKFAAAFGRLCVETSAQNQALVPQGAAAFGRLCVETPHRLVVSSQSQQPPSGGCVLKHDETSREYKEMLSSRLRAAVC